MFEDLIKPKCKISHQYYMCKYAILCDSIHCLHKQPHGNTELGRPEQPEGEDPCDCSKVICEYKRTSGAVCKPI